MRTGEPAPPSVPNLYDAIVVGGPAGLAAAQQLARGCAPTLLLDAGVPRNADADYVNGYLGLDGTAPQAAFEGALAARRIILDLRSGPGLVDVRPVEPGCAHRSGHATLVS